MEGSCRAGPKIPRCARNDTNARHHHHRRRRGRARRRPCAPGRRPPRPARRGPQPRRRARPHRPHPWPRRAWRRVHPRRPRRHLGAGARRRAAHNRLVGSTLFWLRRSDPAPRRSRGRAGGCALRRRRELQRGGHKRRRAPGRACPAQRPRPAIRAPVAGQHGGRRYHFAQRRRPLT